MKIRLLTLLAIPALLCGTSFTAQAGPMNAAITLLEQAKAKVQEASADKGGHRGKAINAIDNAIAQVQAGIDFDKTHDSGARENRKKKN